jgi:hypothetical protein
MVCHIKKERRLRMLEIRVLRKKFGPKREKIAECWGKKIHRSIHNLYSLPHIILVIKSRGVKWAGYVACV